MDETTTLAVVGLALLVLVVGRLVLAMLGGGRGSGRTPVSRAVRRIRTARSCSSNSC